MQKMIADLYDLLALKAGPQAEKDEYSQKALEARTKLLNYVGTTKWTECNKNNPDAIHAAEALMNEGVKNAAGRHTALGRAWVSQAQSQAEGSADAKSSTQRKSKTHEKPRWTCAIRTSTTSSSVTSRSSPSTSWTCSPTKGSRRTRRAAASRASGSRSSSRRSTNRAIRAVPRTKKRGATRRRSGASGSGPFPIR